MHRMHANRVSANGTSSAISDQSMQKIKDAIQKPIQKRTAQQQSAPIKSVESTTKDIRIASLKDIPEGFERVGTGFFRQGHHLWELKSSNGEYVLSRKRGEDHVLCADPEPIAKLSAVSDRFGRNMRIGSKATFPLRGKEAAGTIVVIQPDSVGVELDTGGVLNMPPDMVSCEEFGPQMEPSSKSDQTHGPVAEPPSEPKVDDQPSLEQMPRDASKVWSDYWLSVGQRVAASHKPLNDEQKMKRRERRKERKQELAGLPKDTPMPLRPKSSAIDDPAVKLKERLRVYEQFVDELKYIMQDDSLRDDEVRLADELDQALDNWQQQFDELDNHDQGEAEDKLSLETPSQIENQFEKKTPKISMKMQDLVE